MHHTSNQRSRFRAVEAEVPMAALDGQTRWVEVSVLDDSTRVLPPKLSRLQVVGAALYLPELDAVLRVSGGVCRVSLTVPAAMTDEAAWSVAVEAVRGGCACRLYGALHLTGQHLTGQHLTGQHLAAVMLR